jgi:putative effector of murein hydrolase
MFFFLSVISIWLFLTFVVFLISFFIDGKYSRFDRRTRFTLALNYAFLFFISPYIIAEWKYEEYKVKKNKIQ